MKSSLTPKQVARAIEVSESSVKRWCDKGVISTLYTAGGHRRIPMEGLLKFLRSSKHTLVRPEVVGLPVTSGQTTRVISRVVEEFTSALVAGDEDRCRSITFDLYLADHALSTIFDSLYVPAFKAIGEQWECGDAEVYQERRGCEITLRVLNEVRGVVAQPEKPIHTAIGAAPEGDQYNLSTNMVEIVLRECGWHATNLGDNLPFATLQAAIERHEPRLFWLSCSHIADVEVFVSGYNSLRESITDDVAFAIGGRALNQPMLDDLRFDVHCDSLKELETFVQGISGSSD